jgi:hypothetical protein
MKLDQLDNANKDLWLKNTFNHGDKKIVLACLIRSEDIRPLKAPWWRGKEAYLIGVDVTGNFILRHCDGSVRYWSHEAQADEILAPSVRDFIKGLSEGEE